ncbi:hypothetical protein BVI2075_680014 [Burkholderia vietnamiensis]|nr:hypothetical protein BVI2075_680014 [Burkholderia vietnamiensis]
MQIMGRHNAARSYRPHRPESPTQPEPQTTAPTREPHPILSQDNPPTVRQPTSPERPCTTS